MTIIQYKRDHYSLVFGCKRGNCLFNGGHCSIYGLYNGINKTKLSPINKLMCNLHSQRHRTNYNIKCFNGVPFFLAFPIQKSNQTNFFCRSWHFIANDLKTNRKMKKSKSISTHAFISFQTMMIAPLYSDEFITKLICILNKIIIMYDCHFYY